MKAVSYSRTAIKALKNMPAKDSAAIQAKIANYASGGIEDVQRLKGSDLYRLRHGDWRAVFEQDGTVIYVVKVAGRGEVYRR
jgi:mRNA interferase RelE/StbE